MRSFQIKKKHLRLDPDSVNIERNSKWLNNLKPRKNLQFSNKQRILSLQTFFIKDRNQIIPDSKHCLRCDRVRRRRKAVGQPAVQEKAAPEARHPVAREGRNETGTGERVGQFLTVGKLGDEMVPERQVRQRDEKATGNSRGRVRWQIRP